MKGLECGLVQVRRGVTAGAPGSAEDLVVVARGAWVELQRCDLLGAELIQMAGLRLYPDQLCLPLE
jgi:hypothetical protein